MSVIFDNKASKKTEQWNKIYDKIPLTRDETSHFMNGINIGRPGLKFINKDFYYAATDSLPNISLRDVNEIKSSDQETKLFEQIKCFDIDCHRIVTKST